jgi:hypothetical protein
MDYITLRQPTGFTEIGSRRSCQTKRRVETEATLRMETLCSIDLPDFLARIVQLEIQGMRLGKTGTELHRWIGAQVGKTVENVAYWLDAAESIARQRVILDT